MKQRILAASLAASLLLLVPAVQARAASKADAYFGYSRVGANLYAPNTSGMNGWQAAFQSSRFGLSEWKATFRNTARIPRASPRASRTVMFGPRVTVHALRASASSPMPSPALPLRAQP